MSTSDNISAIEAIEKAMEGVTQGDWYLAGKLTIRHMSVVGGPDGWIGKVNWRNGEANAAYIAACNPVAMSAILAEARKVEAMEREIAYLRGLIRDNGTPRFNAVCERAEKAESCLRDFIKAHHDGAGFLDCVNNKGERYTSHFLDEAISRARALLSKEIADAQG